jgi:C-terminal processing protease CtpA/Prc
MHCDWFTLSTATFASETDKAASGQDADANTPAISLFESLCQALQDNYPTLEFAGWRGHEWIPDFRARILAAPTREAAFELMDELVCRLNDYHTRLSWPSKARLVGPGIRVEAVLPTAALPPDYGIWGKPRPPLELPALDGIVMAVVDAGTDTGLQPGDEVLRVDDVPVREALAQAWRHAVGSSVAGKLRSAAWRMLLGPAQSELRLQVRRLRPPAEEEIVVVTMVRSKAPSESTVSLRRVDGVPVIRIARWSNGAGEDLVARFDQVLGEVRHCPGIVIDVRRNGGGKDEFADQVVGRFLDRPIVSSICFDRQVPSLTFAGRVVTMSPRGPWRYDGRVAVLIDEGCMSACARFVSGMIEAGALTCGTPVSGACGLIRKVELPGGLRLDVSRTFPLNTGGIPLPQFGLAPHLWTPRTLDDVRTGEDTALVAALGWVKSKDPLPRRVQPLVTYSPP